jgi:hypothetical protein
VGEEPVRFRLVELGAGRGDEEDRAARGPIAGRTDAERGAPGRGEEHPRRREPRGAGALGGGQGGGFVLAGPLLA